MLIISVKAWDGGLTALADISAKNITFFYGSPSDIIYQVNLNARLSNWRRRRYIHWSGYNSAERLKNKPGTRGHA